MNLPRYSTPFPAPSIEGNTYLEGSLPSTPSPLAPVLSPEDEELLFSVMNTNTPVEDGNFWFPKTHEGDLPALESILHASNNSLPSQTRVDRKKAQQSNASKRYRIKKKLTTEHLTQENAYLQRELQMAQQQVTLLSQQLSSLQSQLSQAQISLQAASVTPVSPGQASLQEQLESTQTDLQTTLQYLKASLNACMQQGVNFTATFEDPLLQANNVKIHLDAAHQLVLRHHNAWCSLAQSVIAPNTHAYWATFEPPHKAIQPQQELVASECLFSVADTNNIWWRDYALTAQASQQQLSQISSLQRRYCQGIARIKKERFQYSLQVREFYWQRVYRVQFRFPGPTSPDTTTSALQVTQVELLCKLQLLKHNIEQERTLLSETYNELSFALHPLQEALLLVKLFEEAQSHLDHFHSVHQIWEKMGGEVEAHSHDKNCTVM